MKKLSILVCTLDSRKDFLDRLKTILDPQVSKNSELVELLIEQDSGAASIGRKRNNLLKRAQGEYVAFVDDDDIVSSDYVERILGALEGEPDCVGIHLLHFNDNTLAGFTYHSLDYRSWFQDKDTSTGMMRYYRNPNHLNPIRREHALKVLFPEISMGEDREYSKNILQYLKTEKYIVEPIYYYLFRSKK